MVLLGKPGEESTDQLDLSSSLNHNPCETRGRQGQSRGSAARVDCVFPKKNGRPKGQPRSIIPTRPAGSFVHARPVLNKA